VIVTFCNWNVLEKVPKFTIFKYVEGYRLHKGSSDELCFVHFFLFSWVFCCCTRSFLSGVQTLHCALILWEMNEHPRTHPCQFETWLNRTHF